VELTKQEFLRPHWWFSGCYSGNMPDDPVNNHAVRQHWLIDPKTWDDPKKFALLPNADRFLRDVGELGATQVELNRPMSTACQALVQNRNGILHSRNTQQVISGAGLVISVPAIRRLPPFMNAKDLVVWVDDHLKRKLHEAIGDIAPLSGFKPRSSSKTAIRMELRRKISIGL
jgi:hypothetical protein